MIKLEENKNKNENTATRLYMAHFFMFTFLSYKREAAKT